MQNILNVHISTCKIFSIWTETPCGRKSVLANFSLFIFLCFNSNYRAVLLTSDFEKPINTHDDVIERGAGAYGPAISFDFFFG